MSYIQSAPEDGFGDRVLYKCNLQGANGRRFVWPNVVSNDRTKNSSSNKNMIVENKGSCGDIQVARKKTHRSLKGCGGVQASGGKP